MEGSVCLSARLLSFHLLFSLLILIVSLHRRAHLAYQQGVLYTMAHDPGVPASVRATMAKWGLCADEFTDHTLAPHWPPSLYVRAARRLRGGHVFSQNTPAAQRAAGGLGDLSIAIGGYNFDSHNAQRWACRNASACFGKAPPGTPAGASYAWDEGDVQIAPGLYQIPYWVMTPSEEQVGNLLVVAAVAATHVGMSTLRMEPQARARLEQRSVVRETR